MIMTLSLAVFSGLEWKLRNAMEATNTKLKNQVGKLTDKITMRYVFQIFSGVQTIIVRQKGRFYFHIKDQAYEILKLLGVNYQKNILDIIFYAF